MENNASFGLWSPEKHDGPHQSLWLQTTLSEFDKKMKAMMTLLGEDDNSSVQGIEIYDNRKPQLIQMLGELNKSYRCLAEQHDQLRRSKSHHVLHSGSSSSSSSSTSQKKIRESRYNHRRAVRSFNVPKLEASDSHSDDPDVECNSGCIDFELLNKLADELMMTDEPCKTNFKATGIRDDEIDKETTEILNNKDMEINDSGSELGQAMTRYFVTGSSGWENAWPELKFQVIKLLEENLRQLAELLKRNEEKRKIITELQAQLERSKSENRALQGCLSFREPDIKRCQFQRARSRGSSFSKLFKVGCS